MQDADHRVVGPVDAEAAEALRVQEQQRRGAPVLERDRRRPAPDPDALGAARHAVADLEAAGRFRVAEPVEQRRLAGPVEADDGDDADALLDG